MKNKSNFFSRTVYMLAVFIVTLSNLVAQTEKIAFEKYGIAEGLPEEVGLNFVQDKQGFIWIATQNGLAKFDGYKMHVFRANPDNPNGLQLRNLNGGLLIASDNKLWIAAVGKTGGLSSYDPKTETFTNYAINIADSTKVPNQTNSVLFEDITKNIWFNSYDESQSFICKIDPKTQKVSRYPYLVGRKNNDIVLNFAIAESKKDSSIWLNNDNKIIRYDRKKDAFETQFKAGDIIPGTTYRDTIIDINSIKKDGLIALSNNDRLFLFDPILRKVIETYEFTNRSDISWGAQFEDTHGNIWVSSHDNLTRINRELGQREDFKFGEGALDFKMNGNTTQIIPEEHNEDFILFEVTTTDSNNESFIYTLRYDINSKSFELFDYQFNDENNSFINNGFIRNYAIDKTGLLWVGTRPNIYKQSPKTRQIKHYKHDDKDEFSLPSDLVTTIFEDSKQQLWVGTTEGIALKQGDGSFKTIGWFGHGKTGKSMGSVDEIIEDSNDVIWVATETGLYRWNASRNLFEKLLITMGENIDVATLIEDNKNCIWVSIWDRGVYVLDKKSGNILKRFESNNSENHQLSSTNISVIYLDSKNRIWLGDPFDNEIGLFRYRENENKFVHYNNQVNDSTSISSNEIRFLAEDNLNRIWVGTDGGLNLYDSQKDIFQRNNDALNIPSTRTFVKANNGKMWVVAYSGGGLMEVGPEVNDVTTYGEDKGLLHNDATNLVFDDLGKLWLPTERGLSVFDTLTKTYTSYFEKDGFQKYGRRNSILKTKNGDIWIGGQDGLNHITPSELSKKDTTIPSVYITEMGIMDSIYSAPDGDMFSKAVSYTQEVTLKHWQKDLSFNFVGVHFLRPEENQYSYKLENYDNNWSSPSKERRAAYTNLSPGTYIFNVKSSNADGVWNEEGATIKVIISPPWWFTWWAYVIYACILGLIGRQIHKSQKARTLRHAREEAQQKELEQAKEIEKAYTELKSTQAQLIQSEKMASLGELTAGIAHEIQNPLNFVNNFAEVNSELIDEMKEEIDNGNLEEVKNLADDINDNEKKIMFHGKRADSIVKGMLQHSRISNGKKEPTDINALADEYFRLAYHGLRAKDKSFNATMVSDFDESIKKVSIIPQDIGRVILNLITNAFYIVDEKKKSGIKNYEPIVTVRTMNDSEHINIQVIDNGNGIPENIVSKIFEPFFTTKPTGKGTGLGLSMSYDIITNSHGGELKVETKKGEGTTFTITLLKQNI